MDKRMQNLHFQIIENSDWPFFIQRHCNCRSVENIERFKKYDIAEKQRKKSVFKNNITYYKRNSRNRQNQNVHIRTYKLKSVKSTDYIMRIKLILN